VAERDRAVARRRAAVHLRLRPPAGPDHGAGRDGSGDGGGVARFTPGGELDAVVDVPADFVSSLSFSGTDVLITTIGTLFRGRSEVAGVPVTPATI
jgi:hypothetical protein